MSLSGILFQIEELNKDRPLQFLMILRMTSKLLDRSLPRLFTFGFRVERARTSASGLICSITHANGVRSRSRITNSCRCDNSGWARTEAKLMESGACSAVSFAPAISAQILSDHSDRSSVRDTAGFNDTGPSCHEWNA